MPPNRLFTGYHGYWPVAPREVNQRFGTTESLRSMVRAAHGRGIKVIMDCVANHVHVEHPYYKTNPGWFGVYSLPDGRKNVRLFDEFPLTTWFDTFLPKFDYALNPAAIRVVVEDMAWWVETFGFDGLRHDATKHIPHEFWLALTSRIREIEAKRGGAAIFQIGESIAGRDTIMDYVNAAEMDGQFDFPLYWPIRSAFASQAEKFDGLVKAISENRRAYGGFSVHSAFVGNHDFSRFIGFATGAVPPNGEKEQAIGWENPPTQPSEREPYDSLRMAHTFVMTQPDHVPLVYYGDEFGLTGAGDPDNRRMMKFGAEVPAHGRDVMKHVRRLTALRKAHPALRTGDVTVLGETGDVLIILRSHQNARVLVAFNRKEARETVSVQLPEWARSERFRTEPEVLLAGNQTTIKAGPQAGVYGISMEPRSSAIFLLTP
jgi:glycosidase